VSRAQRWLDPASTSFAVALAIALAVANGIWILVDNGVPAWDQAHYLGTTLQYQHSLESGGPIDLLRSIHGTDPSHGPLYTVLILPFFLVFGASAGSAMALNLVLAPVLYFCAGEIAWTIFRSTFARLLTMFLVATTPILIGLYHNVLQEFTLTTLATLSLLLLLRSEAFERRWTTWGMAFAMGLGTLTKVTFPAFVIGPFLVVLARAVLTWTGRDPEVERRDWRPAAFNLGIAAAILLVVAGVWYGPNLSATLDYIRSTTSGPLSEGAGPKDPITFHAITWFTTGVINFNLSWVILGLGLVAVALNWRKVGALLGRPRPTKALWSLAFLLAWVLIPYLSVALAHNQDVRLMAPAFPGVAVLVAGAVAAIERAQLRLALTGVAALVLAYQTLNHVTDVTTGFLPDRPHVTVGSYEAAVQLDTEPIGYERLPGDDYATPIFEYIEDVARSEPGGLSTPRMICMLESQQVVNSNTFSFYAAARDDPFLFADILVDPATGEKGLEETLAGCNFALYVKQPQPTQATKESRIVLVNEPYAANHMTPRLFALFSGPTRVFPVSEPPAGSAGGYLATFDGELARVLTR
jgi:4-amino-4-deoxy-L-arabinose transferase-like glycosyltransferase